MQDTVVGRCSDDAVAGTVCMSEPGIALKRGEQFTWWSDVDGRGGYVPHQAVACAQETISLGSLITAIATDEVKHRAKIVVTLAGSRINCVGWVTIAIGVTYGCRIQRDFLRRCQVVPEEWNLGRTIMGEQSAPAGGFFLPVIRYVLFLFEECGARQPVLG